MELKRFQKQVINDLELFLSFTTEKGGDYIKGYDAYRAEKGQQTNPLGPIKPYINTIKNCPHICLKVPTAGGKTFIACNAIKSIFHYLKGKEQKVVVWLVPSRAILLQTYQNLKNPNHPYHQKIASQFNGAVEVYDKVALIMGAGFNTTSVKEQLTICVLSYDTFRRDNKEERKIYQENSSLYFPEIQQLEKIQDKIDETSLMHVLHHLNPVVIVDESHNASTDLSIDMLKNLNPCFVLDLSATPNEKISNILKPVNAIQLRKENMIKLPIIVYNQHEKTDVINKALSMQRSLEREAIEYHKQGGPYIRPIVLFQAEPKGDNDNETFEKIKEKLVKAGIPEEQIAIKTANKDEIKSIDLLSKECAIRYIITVNALKEGRDCPFAYVLASLANRSSPTDLTQIVGRILRLPFVMQHKAEYLNYSYVFCSSTKFYETLESIVIGLNNAGFSDTLAPGKTVSELATIRAIDMDKEKNLFDDPLADEIDEAKIVLGSEEYDNQALQEIKQQASLQGAMMEEFLQGNELADRNSGPYTKKSYSIKPYNTASIEHIVLPQFHVKIISESLIDPGEKWVLLQKKSLEAGFDLKTQETSLSLNDVESEIFKIDVEDEGGMYSKIRYSKVPRQAQKRFIEHVNVQTPEKQLQILADKIFQEIRYDFQSILDADIKFYIRKVVEILGQEHLDNLKENITSYSTAIKKKIEHLLGDYTFANFKRMLDANMILCKGSYTLPVKIQPNKTVLGIKKSLYEEEDDMNGLEKEVINEIVDLENILWWHRIIERQGFCINGPLNHYPDFMLYTTRGNCILLETKGPHLDNTDSKRKIALGNQWQNEAGKQFKYFMVFKDEGLDGAYSVSNILGIIKDL